MIENDVRIERQLGREPKPELSPFFAARVTNELRSRTRVPARTPLILRVYWLALLVASVFMVQATVARFDLAIVSLVLVPLGFGLWIYRDEAAARLLELTGVLFGSRDS